MINSAEISYLKSLQPVKLFNLECPCERFTINGSTSVRYYLTKIVP